MTGRAIQARQALSRPDYTMQAVAEDNGDNRKVKEQAGCTDCGEPSATWRTDGKGRQLSEEILEPALQLSQ